MQHMIFQLNTYSLLKFISSVRNFIFQKINKQIELQTKYYCQLINQYIPDQNITIEQFYTSLQDSIVLTKLLDIAEPDSVNFKKFIYPKNGKPINPLQSQSNARFILQYIKKANIQLVNVGSTDIVQGKPQMILQILQQIFKRIFSNEMKKFIKDNEDQLKQLLNQQQVVNQSIEQQLIQFYQSIIKDCKIQLVLNKIEDLTNINVYLIFFYRFDWILCSNEYNLTYNLLQSQGQNESQKFQILQLICEQLVKYSTEHLQQGQNFNNWIMLACKLLQFYLSFPPLNKNILKNELNYQEDQTQKDDIENYIDSIYYYFNKNKKIPEFEYRTLKLLQDRIKYMGEKEGLLPSHFPIQLIEKKWVMNCYFQHQYRMKYQTDQTEEIKQYLMQKYKIDIQSDDQQILYENLIKIIIQLNNKVDQNDIQQVYEQLNDQDKKSIINEYLNKLQQSYPYDEQQILKQSIININFMFNSIKNFKKRQIKYQICQSVLLQNFNFLMEFNKKDLKIQEIQDINFKLLQDSFNSENSSIQSILDEYDTELDDERLQDPQYLLYILQILIQRLYCLNQLSKDWSEKIKNLNFEDETKIFNKNQIKEIKQFKEKTQFLQNDLSFYTLQKCFIDRKIINQILNDFQLQTVKYEEKDNFIEEFEFQTEKINYLYKFVTQFYSFYQKIKKTEEIQSLKETKFTEVFHNQILILEQISLKFVQNQVLCQKFQQSENDIIKFINSFLNIKYKSQQYNQLIINISNFIGQNQEEIKEFFLNSEKWEENERNIKNYLLIQLIYKESSKYEKYIIYTQECLDQIIQMFKCDIKQTIEIIKQKIYFKDYYIIQNQNIENIKYLWQQLDKEKDNIKQIILNALLCQYIHCLQEISELFKIQVDQEEDQEKIVIKQIKYILDNDKFDEQQLNDRLTIYLQKQNFKFEDYDFSQRNIKSDINDQKLMKQLLKEKEINIKYSILSSKLLILTITQENDKLIERYQIPDQQIINLIISYIELHQNQLKQYKTYIKFVKKENFIKFSLQHKNFNTLISILTGQNIYYEQQVVEDTLKILQENGFETRFIYQEVKQDDMLQLCCQIIFNRVNTEQMKEYFQQQFEIYEVKDINQACQNIYNKSEEQMIQQCQLDKQYFNEQILTFIFLIEPDKIKLLCLFKNQEIILKISNILQKQYDNINSLYEQLKQYYIDKEQLEQNTQINDILKLIGENVYLDQNDFKTHQEIGIQLFTEQLLMQLVNKQLYKYSEQFIEILIQNSNQIIPETNDLKQFVQNLLNLSEIYQIKFQLIIEQLNQRSPLFTIQNLKFLFMISLIWSYQPQIQKQLKLNGLPINFEEIKWEDIQTYYKKYKPDETPQKPKQLTPLLTQILLLKANNWIPIQPILLSDEYLLNYLQKELKEEVQLVQTSVSKLFQLKCVTRAELSKNIQQIYKQTFLKSPSYQLTCYIQQYVFKPQIQSEILYKWIQQFIQYDISDQFLQNNIQVNEFLQIYFADDQQQIEKYYQFYTQIKQIYWKKQFFTEIYNESDKMIRFLIQMDYKNIQMLNQLNYENQYLIQNINKNLQIIFESETYSINQESINQILQENEFQSEIKDFKNQKLVQIFIICKIINKLCPEISYYKKHIRPNFYQFLLNFNIPFDQIDENIQIKAKNYLTNNSEIDMRIGMFKFINCLFTNGTFDEKVKELKSLIQREFQQRSENFIENQQNKLNQSQFDYFMSFIQNLQNMGIKLDNQEQFDENEIQNVIQIRKFLIKRFTSHFKTQEQNNEKTDNNSDITDQLNESQDSQQVNKDDINDNKLQIQKIKLLNLIKQMEENVTEENLVQKLIELGCPFSNTEIELNNQEELYYSIQYLRILIYDEQN